MFIKRTLMALCVALNTHPALAQQSASAVMDIEARLLYTERAMEVYYCGCMELSANYCHMFDRAWERGEYVGSPRIPNEVMAASQADVDNLCRQPDIQSRVAGLAGTVSGN